MRPAAAVAAGVWASLMAQGCSRGRPAAGPEAFPDAPPPAAPGLGGYADVMVSAKASALRVSCQANLRQLGVALEAHAVRNDERYPSSLDELVAAGLLAGPSAVTCPATRRPYGYVAGLGPGAPGEWVVAFDGAGSQPGGRNVLRASRSVEWMDEAAFEAALRATLDGARARGLSVEVVDGGP
jgi:hypothetical protein